LTPEIPSLAPGIAPAPLTLSPLVEQPKVVLALPPVQVLELPALGAPLLVPVPSQSVPPLEGPVGGAK